MSKRFAHEALVEALHIDKHRLEDMCEQQPELLHQVAEELASCISERDMAKTGLTEVRAEAAERLRSETDKISEAKVESLLPLEPDVMRATTTLHELNAQVGGLSALKEAYVDRSHMLRQLTTLYVANYYSETGDLGRANAKAITGARAREAMNTQRRRLNKE